MDEKKLKKEFEKFYPGAKLRLRPEEKARRDAKRLKFFMHGFGWSFLCGILAGGPAWVLILGPIIIGLCCYYGVRDDVLAKED